MKILILLAAVTAASGDRMAAQEMPAWPDTYVGRLQALALEQTIHARILASRSATLALEAWCGEHHLSDESIVVAELDRSLTKTATPEQRKRLQVGADTPVRYRKVRLRCGSRVLSEAENWYVPERLTPQMNQVLETTNTAFGKVVQPLEPYRETFAVKMLWSPLPDGWELGPAPAEGNREALKMPDELFEHRAVLYTRAHVPFSEVDEVYQKQLLAFSPPKSFSK